MTVSKLHERFALGAAFLAAMYAVGIGLLAGVREERWLGGAAALAGVGAALSLLTMMHAVLRRQAAEEERSADDLDEGGLFSEQEGARIKARNLRQFERYFVPSVTTLLALAEFVGGLFILRLLAGAGVVKADNARLFGAVLLISAVLFYLFGSYLGGLAFSGKATVLRAVAGELIGLAWISGACGVLALLSLTGMPNWSLVCGRVITILLMLRGVEKVLTVLLEIYRPRRRDAEERLVYESRLNGLVAQPRSIAANFAETINYQFGINLSRTGLRGVFLVAVLTLAFHVVVLCLLSCFVIVNVGEQAVIERWGQPLPGVRNPGVHVKLPWPVDCVYRHPVDQVHEIQIGPTRSKQSKTALWTDVVAAEMDVFVTASRSDSDSDAKGGQTTTKAAFSLVNASAIVQYQVADLRQYIYASGEPDRLLELIARREMVRLFAGRELLDVLQQGRDELNDELLASIQEQADKRGLGVKIQFAGVRRLQPPPKAVADFQEVMAADQDRKRLELDAAGEGEATITRTLAEREQTLAEAESYRDRRVKVAQAEADSYRKLLDLYTEHREIYRSRAYLDQMEKLRDVRKVVLATDLENQIIKIDLKKSKSELFELTEGAE